MKQTNIKLQQQHLLSLPLHMPKKYNTEMCLIWTNDWTICIKGLLTVAKIYLIVLYFYLTPMFFPHFIINTPNHDQISYSSHKDEMSMDYNKKHYDKK